MRKPVQTLSLLVLIAAAPEPPAVIRLQAIDFALDWQQYIGRRVQIDQVSFYTAQVDRAAVSIPGSMASVSLSGVPRATIKSLILHCNPPTERARCTTSITATVARTPIFDWPTLKDVAIGYFPALEP